MSQQSDTPNNSTHNQSLEDIACQLEEIKKSLTNLSEIVLEHEDGFCRILDDFMKKSRSELADYHLEIEKLRRNRRIEEFERGTALFLPPPYVDDEPDDYDRSSRLN